MNTDYRAIVDLDRAKPTKDPLLFRPGANLRTGIEDYVGTFPDPTSLEQDILLVASTIFACDLAFKRDPREDVARNISLTIPVVNRRAFQMGKSDLESLLWFVSRDNWEINFGKAEGIQEPGQKWESSSGRTLLFSGGLDSLAGAVDLLEQADKSRLQLVSHVTGNRITRSSQNDLAAYLQKRFGKLDRFVVRSGGRNRADFYFPPDDKREETQRTRSFMYLAIAILAARRRGWNKIVMMAENGQMAIHLALSAARAGAFSTRTAHPQFIRAVEKYFSELLDYPIEIENPYEYRTKAEVISRLSESHPTSLPLAVSCWRSARLLGIHKHCGECVPCQVRRIAIEYHGRTLAEYKRDLLQLDIAALPDDDEGKRNLMELATFAQAFLLKRAADLENDYPDMINADVDRKETIAMYKRFAREAHKVWGRYPKAKLLLI